MREEEEEVGGGGVSTALNSDTSKPEFKSKHLMRDFVPQKSTAVR